MTLESRLGVAWEDSSQGGDIDKDEWYGCWNDHLPTERNKIKSRWKEGRGATSQMVRSALVRELLISDMI